MMDKYSMPEVFIRNIVIASDGTFNYNDQLVNPDVIDSMSMFFDCEYNVKKYTITFNRIPDPIENFYTGSILGVNKKHPEFIKIVDFGFECSTMPNENTYTIICERIKDDEALYNILREHIKICTRLLSDNPYALPFGDIESYHIPVIKPIAIPTYPAIERLIYQDTNTVVKWFDGTTTVVRIHADDKFDEEVGLAMAIARKYFEYEGYNPYPRAEMLRTIKNAERYTKKENQRD